MVGRRFVVVLLALERAFEDDEDRYIFIQCITSRHVSCPETLETSCPLCCEFVPGRNIYGLKREKRLEPRALPPSGGKTKK